MYQTLDVDLWLVCILKIVCDVDRIDGVVHLGISNTLNFHRSGILLRQIFEECFYLIQRMLHCEENEYSIHVYRIL